MSAWKWMSPAARIEAIHEAVAAGSSKWATADKYGADVDVVTRLAQRHRLTWFEDTPPATQGAAAGLGSEDTDEGTPADKPAKPPESPACEGTPTPDAAEHAPGEGGPDGGSSAVAGATSDGGGDGAQRREGRAPYHVPAASKSKRPKRMASAGVPLPPEAKAEPAADEIAVTIYLPRWILAVLQERAEKPRWTRAQMAAAMVIQACNKKD